MAAAMNALRTRTFKRKTRKEKEDEERQKAQEMFANLDADGDGQVSPEEIAQAMARGKIGAPATAPMVQAPVDGGEPVDWLPHREVVQYYFDLQWFQFFIAGVIVFNFLAIVLEKEIDPYESKFQRYYHVWSAIDFWSNVIFTIELMLNLYANFWKPFLRNPWNYLDTMVVVVGLLNIASVPLGPFAFLKILRVFRIVRIFKRVESLNKILTALLRSIPGVLNAFAVMLIVMCIYAILAVDLFRSFGSDGDYTTIQTYGVADGQYGPYCGPDALECINGSIHGGRFEENSNISSMTARGFYYGQEYYGTFSRALYTLFQVLTGESWSEAVVRPLIFGYTPQNSHEDVGPNSALMVGLFFTSYILITSVVLQNVVVAVLLDKFVEDPEKEKKPDADPTAAAETDEKLTSPMAASPAAADASCNVPTPPTSGPRKGPMSDAETLAMVLHEQEEMRRMLAEILQRLPASNNLEA